jgi:hypothetical protein
VTVEIGHIFRYLEASAYLGSVALFKLCLYSNFRLPCDKHPYGDLIALKYAMARIDIVLKADKM